VAVARPAAFRWFVALAPGSYTATLGFIMLAMGLTLQLRDFAALLRDRPLAVRDRIRIPSRSIFPRAIVIGYPNGGLVDPTRCFSVLLQILFGCAAQYTIMPAFGAIVSLALGLPPSLSAGLILLACCPGGTASNVVRLSTEPSLSHSQFLFTEWGDFFPPSLLFLW
jgi:BASS family bile acid:Na+ symporter